MLSCYQCSKKSSKCELSQNILSTHHGNIQLFTDPHPPRIIVSRLCSIKDDRMSDVACSRFQKKAQRQHIVHFSAFIGHVE